MRAKGLFKLLGPVLFAVMAAGCVTVVKDYADVPDNTPPGQVTNVTYTASPGGAVLYYTLPGDEDLIGVKAVYTNERGMELIVRSSRYVDSLTVIGLASTDRRDVALYAVDNSNNESEPVTVTIIPGQSQIHNIAESVTMEPYAGGVRLRWSNPDKLDIAVSVLYMDATEEYVPYETFYSNEETGRGVKTGKLEPVRSYFGVYIRDRWGNTTPVKYYAVTPEPYMIYPNLAKTTAFKVTQFTNNLLYAEMEQVTYEAWIRMNAYEEEFPFIASVMGIETADAFLIRIVSDEIEVPTFAKMTATTRVKLDEWYHIAVTYDGSVAKLYVDGNEEASRQKTGLHDMSVNYLDDGAFMIGQSFGGRWFDGEISDVRIWSVARTRMEINNNMCGVDPGTPGLVANWRFDERKGTAIKDYSPNGYDIEAGTKFEWTVAPPACDKENE
jgi:hypothetical protein